MKHQKFDWIAKIIESCTDSFHFQGVEKLIDLFSEQEKDEELTSHLKLLTQEKFLDVHNILY